LECGVTTFKICPRELQSNKLIEWKNIGYEVVRKINEGGEKEAQKLAYHLTLLKELLEYLYPHLKEFVLHNYVSRWQDLQFRKCLKNLHPKTILSCVDFSENYTMKIHNKI